MKNSIIFFVAIIIATLFLHLSSNAQRISKLDSLQSVLAKENTDTATLKKYLKTIKKYNSDDIESIEVTAKWIIKKADDNNAPQIKAEALKMLGSSYVSVARYEEATNYLNEAIAIAEKNNFYEINCRSLIGLFRVYHDNRQNKEAISYLEKSIEVAEKNKYPYGIIMAKFEMSTYLESIDSLKNKNTFLKIINLKKDALAISKNLKDTSSMFKCNIGLGEAFSSYKFFDSAIIYLKDAESLITNKTDKFVLLSLNAIIGKVYKERAQATNNKNDFEKSIIYSLSSVKLANELNEKYFEYNILKGLSEEYKGIGDYKTAFDYLNQYTNLHDSISNAQNFKEITDIRSKYEITKKDSEILKLDTSNQQKSTLNKILIGSALGLILLSLLGYRNFKNKQKVSSQQQELQKQKIAELEKDKQLLAIDAMLQGQEEERSRIAKDLHDGLGGMLSGTKLSFINMKENLVLTPENATQFDKSISMLDNTIADLRKVAHNLMPEALVKFGLQEAVRDFCNSIQSSTNLKVVYQPLGVQTKLSNTAEVFTYRIIQELVNNAVKHANATQIIVQLTTNNNKIGIAVEDNGKGFDANALANSKGAGMDNIKYRVQYFNGTIDTVTSTGSGTSVNIELSV
jgi:two-component system, NarL family, sensor kinase